MRQDVAEFIAKCERCQLTKTTEPKHAPLKSLPVPQAPNERVHVDLFGPLKTSQAGNKYIMVMTDAFTKYVELAAIEDKTALTVARTFLERWICRFSAPVMLVTDQGKEFCNYVLEGVCKLWDVDKKRTSPFHPQTNSAAESYNRSLIKYMRAVIKDNQTLEWEELLPAMAFSYNCHVHRSTGECPFFLTFLHDPRLPIFDLEKPRQFYKHGFVEDSYMTMQKAFGRAKISMQEAAKKSKQYYDRKTQERSFKSGDRVIIHFPNVPPGQNGKFWVKWRPYTVLKCIGQLNLQCQDEQKKSKPIIVHKDRVAHFKSDELACISSWSITKEEDAVLSTHRKEDEEYWEEPAIAFKSVEVQQRSNQQPALEDGGQTGFWVDPWYSLGRAIWGEARTTTDGEHSNTTRASASTTTRDSPKGQADQATGGRDGQGLPASGEANTAQGQTKNTTTGGTQAQRQASNKAKDSQRAPRPHTRSRGGVEDVSLPKTCWSYKRT